MDKKYLVVIDTDTQFSKRFSKRLSIKKLDNELQIMDIIPDTTDKINIIENVLKEVSTIISKRVNVAAIFVDIVIYEDGTEYDTTGITLASEIKKLYQNIPVYNISSKVMHKDQLDIFSDATLENNNGVFAKYYLEGETFTRDRLEKILNPEYSKINFDKKTEKSEMVDKCDIAIVTALYENEFETIKNVLKLNNISEDATKLIFHGNMQIKNKKEQKSDIKIVGVSQHKTGIVDAGIFATEIIVRYSPKYLVMTGVCGGKDNNKINFGDIVLANKLFIHQKGKIGELGFEPEAESIDVNEKLLQKIKLNEKNLLRYVMDHDISRASTYKERPLKLFIEPMASSFVVVNRKGYFHETIETVDRKTIAVDMESYAIARSCVIANNGDTIPIIIKSVMDKTKEKTDKAKSYAAYTSSVFLKYLISEVLFQQ